MPVITIESNDGLLAKMIPQSEWKEGSHFFSEAHDYLQVGTWRYSAGKTLGPHIHNEVQRTIHHTSEVIFVYNGSIMASVYDGQKQLVKQVVLKEGDTLILLKGGHGYEILEDDTRVLEIKNGPYPGPELDRRLINEESNGL